MSRDLPMHALSTNTNASQVAFILIQYQCPRRKTFCTSLSRACPNLQLNRTDTADHTEACSFFSWGLSFGSLDIMLATSQTDGAYCTNFLAGTRTLCALRAVGLHSSGDTWKCLGTFLIVTIVGGVCCWHLVGRSERCC